MEECKIRQFLLNEGADFVFNTNVPHASHMGSIWERQIQSVRNILAELMFQHGQQLDDESRQKEILLKGLCGKSTDSAAAMMRNKYGVVTKLKESFPGVLSTHCILFWNSPYIYSHPHSSFKNYDKVL